MKKEHFRLCFNITPNYCKPITFTAVISESIERFIKRNESEFQTLMIAMVVPCDEKTYNLYKKFNPTKESYAKMLKEDYK